MPQSMAMRNKMLYEGKGKLETPKAFKDREVKEMVKLPKMKKAK